VIFVYWLISAANISDEWKAEKSHTLTNTRKSQMIGIMIAPASLCHFWDFNFRCLIFVAQCTIRFPNGQIQEIITHWNYDSRYMLDHFWFGM
jgi:hypothetical protein